MEICKCPKCGASIEDYWEFDNDNYWYSDDTLEYEYRIHCDCGYRFRYVTKFKCISSAIVEDI